MRIKDILSPESMIMELKATNKEDAIKVRREAELLCYGEFSPLWNDFMQNSVPDELDRQWYIDEAKKRIKGFTGEIL